MSYSKKQIIKLLLKENTLQDFLNVFPDPSTKGYMYELIAELAFVFGQTSLNINDYTMLCGKCIDLIEFTKTNIKNYFNTKAISGNSEGVADVKYIDNKTGKIVVISVKYFHEEKDTTKYDISTMFHKYSKNNLKLEYELQVICNDKKSLEQKFKNAHSENQLVIDDVTKLYGSNDVAEWYRKLKVYFTKTKLEEAIKDLTDKKPLLQLRPHQYIIAEQVKQKFNNGDKEVLINGIPRCGKTYISGGIIQDIKSFIKHKGNNKIAFITPRPTDCKEGYFKMFNEYKDFVGYNLVYLKDDDDYKKSKKECKENEEHKITLKDNSITVLSRQLILDRQMKLDLEGVDLVIFDESHLMCTPYTKQFINELKRRGIKIIHMTGTSQKVEYYYQLGEQDILRYGLNDIINLKDGNIFEYDEELMKQYMENNSLSKKKIVDMYKKYPEMKTYLGTLNVGDEFYNEDKQFSWKKLFAMKNNGKFNHKKSVKQVMSKLFGLDRECDKSIVEEVLEDCDNEDDTNIILVFLPYGQGLGVNKIQDNLEDMLKKDKMFNANYECVSFSSQRKGANENVLKTIEHRRQNLGTKSLVVFLGSMLELGCSIPNANVVITMHDFQSSDKYIQQIYRCLTENKNKSKGAVIDFNSHRILYNQMKVLRNGNKLKTPTEIMKLILKKDMIRIIGEDFDIEAIEQTDIQEIYENINDLDILTQNVYNLSDEVDRELFTFCSKTNNIDGKIAVTENISKEEKEKVSDYHTVRIAKTEEQIKKEEELRRKQEQEVETALEKMDEIEMVDLLNGLRNLLNFSTITIE